VRSDVTVRVLGYMIRSGLAVDAANEVSLLPVDTCARNIVAMSLAGGIPDAIHMTADCYHNVGDICRIISDRHGYPFRSVSLQEFVAHAHRHAGTGDEIYPLLGFLDRNTRRILAMEGKRYSNAGYRHARERTPLTVAHPGIESVVDSIVQFLQRERLVPAPPQNLERPKTVGGAR
jgi:hypothetical protein